MIELNLLPKELRKQEKIVLPEIPVLPISIGVLVFLFIIGAFLFFTVGVKKGTVLSFQSKWEKLEPQRKVVEKVVQAIQDLESREKAIGELSSSIVDWAELLSGLNQSMIPNVWLSDFKPVFNMKRDAKGTAGLMSGTLDLTGYALGAGETATSTVAKFINSLKNHEEFSKYFDDVELDNIRKQFYKDEEVMQFKLICKFKANPQKPV
jgi:hypothetical protein